MFSNLNFPVRLIESTIEDHEDVAVYALWSTVVLGVLSLYSLATQKFQQLKQFNLTFVILLIGIFSTATLAYTAQQGGKIRHPEAYTTNNTVSLSVEIIKDRHQDD